jgi:hypothetical protein
MIGAFLNIRGFNKIGRINCLADFIKNKRLDFVGIQEKKTKLYRGFFENCLQGDGLEI